MNCGLLVNDCLTCIPGTKTFWHDLLEWYPFIQPISYDTIPFDRLATIVEHRILSLSPKIIIRNGSWFRPICTTIPTVSLLQDNLQHNNELFQTQINVLNSSSIAVFNTNYIYDKYKPYIKNTTEIRICPLGVDFAFFNVIHEVHPMVLPSSIVFIGASNTYPKGFDVMLHIMKTMKTQNFCLIMKDDYTYNHLPSELKGRVIIFNKICQEEVRRVINSCICAVVPSYEETQHLSGIECMACNLPVVARAVGIYYDCKNDMEWGCIADNTTFVEKLQYVLNNRNVFTPREYMIKKYSKEVCKNNWDNILSKYII